MKTFVREQRGDSSRRLSRRDDNVRMLGSFGDKGNGKGRRQGDEGPDEDTTSASRVTKMRKLDNTGDVKRVKKH